jgi:hypothetical protein
MTTEQWGTLTLAEQLGNIGSDFERALRWRAAANASLFGTAAARTLELLDLTLTDQRWHTARLNELTRLRGEVCGVLFADYVDPGSSRGLQRYFMSMASMAQRERSRE